MRETFLEFCCVVMAAAPASLWLGGCGRSTAASLRARPHRVLSFEVPAGYRTVYERIALRARQRYVFTGIPTHQPGVSTNLSCEDESATVTLWNSGGIGIRYRLTAEIRAIDPTRTQIDMFTAGKSDNQEARLWALWANTPIEE